MDETSPQSRYVTLPRDRHDLDDRGRLGRFMGSLTGGIIYALAVVVGSVVAAVVVLTTLTLLVVQIVERATGATL
jgi:hypothetical protein